MGFSANAKKIFYEELKMTNRDISRRMDGYSEVMISRNMNSDTLSGTFVEQIIKYFSEEIDFNRLFKDETHQNVVEEKSAEYHRRSLEIVAKMREDLKELETNLSRQ